MELIGLLPLALIGFVVAILRPILTDECKAWLPRIVDYLLNRAVNLLPEDKRERYQEEWRSHIDDLPGDVSRLFEAFRFSIAARHIESSGKYLKIRIIEIMEKIFAVIFLIYSAPVFLIITLLIRLDSCGPAITIQNRLASNNKKIRILKFRTIHVHHDGTGEQEPSQFTRQGQGAEEPLSFRFIRTAGMAEEFRAMQNDPRVTRVGRFLRVTSLDELPQLISVFRGDIPLFRRHPPGTPGD